MQQGKENTPSNRRRVRVRRVAERMASQPSSPTDPDGSYTGRPTNPWERPVQDADDL